MSIAKKAVHGIAWVALSSTIVQVLNFITKIVLARLLAPEDFGLLAIGLLAINAFDLFNDIGLGAALIYKKDDPDHTAANTAFLVLPFAASFLFALSYLSAPYAALFFNNAAIDPILRILSLTFIISSFGTVPSKLLEKELEFKKKIIPDTVSRVGYAAVAIWLALAGYGVWSLVYGQIAYVLLVVVFTWIVSDWRPTFRFNKIILKELSGYGKLILGVNIVLFLIYNIDNAIVGRMIGMEALGFYTIAYMISNLPATQITHLVERVMFPVYSKMQDDRASLKRNYFKTLKYVSMLSVPAAFGIFVVAPDFVRIVLGEKWMPAVPVLQVLCFSGLARSISATTGSIFQGTGRPDIFLKTSFLQLLTMVFLMFLLISRFGIIGVGLAVTIPVIAQSIIRLYLVNRIVDINLNELYVMMFQIFTGSIIMSISLFLLINRVFGMFHLQSFNILILSVLSGGIIYAITLCFMDRNIIREIKQIISNFV